MKYRGIRVAATSAVVFGVAASTMILTAGGAQAATSVWACASFSTPVNGFVNGLTCTGSGTGVGLFVDKSGDDYYRCQKFQYPAGYPAGTTSFPIVYGSTCVALTP